MRTETLSHRCTIKSWRKSELMKSITHRNRQEAGFPHSKVGKKSVFGAPSTTQQSPAAERPDPTRLRRTAGMKRVPHSSRWAERRSTVVYAVRAATFSSWRMLTQGAEYEDTWALSPDRRRPKRAEAAPEEADICAVTSGEPSWGPAQDDLTHKFDTVLHLDGAKGAGLGGGVQQAVWTHETLNNNPLCRR
ncbi:hypothetical protein FQA47_003436 [Oryzias melastigma]|uniref:Uncharacterized protein n=1 Tax=Oryzias melastigma TaxID=30732 RepID=A0A834C3T4_ORYME|nr:hypothetical protein FQA47_003436 [Oryzias melastigma]